MAEKLLSGICPACGADGAYLQMDKHSRGGFYCHHCETAIFAHSYAGWGFICDAWDVVNADEMPPESRGWEKHYRKIAQLPDNVIPGMFSKRPAVDADLVEGGK